MRLWSLHPSYLDVKGLTALWREGLLAQKVLRGLTKGYRNHPQLDRFKALQDPVKNITRYLHAVADEADRRGYGYDRSRIAGPRTRGSTLKVSRGQLALEWKHLRTKLKRRDPARWKKTKASHRPKTHPLFKAVAGPVAGWERAV